MRIFRILAFVVLLIFLSGCVYLDIAAQDTAIPIYPNRFSSAVYFSSGLSLNDTFVEDEEERDGTAAMANGKLAFGINEKVDLIVSMGQTNGQGGSDGGYRYESQQYEMGMKYLLKQEGKTYLSVLPSLYRLRGTQWDAFPGNLRNDVYNAYGVETQLLHSYKSSDYVTATLIGKASLNNIRISRFGDKLPTINSFHYGARANLRLSLGILNQTTEFGFEVIPLVNGNTRISPNFSAGLGLQF